MHGFTRHGRKLQIPLAEDGSRIRIEHIEGTRQFFGFPFFGLYTPSESRSSKNVIGEIFEFSPRPEIVDRTKICKTRVASSFHRLGPKTFCAAFSAQRHSPECPQDLAPTPCILARRSESKCLKSSAVGSFDALVGVRDGIEIVQNGAPDLKP